MLDLTFGEQVKIVLSRRGMTIKELAELIEKQTGKKMSRQNLTQRLSRDNFQEQDMRMIASILECPLHLSILDDSVQSEKISSYNVKNIESDVPTQETGEIIQEAQTTLEAVVENERDITIGELVDIHEAAAEYEPVMEYGTDYDVEEEAETEPTIEEILEDLAALEAEQRAGQKTEREVQEEKSHGWKTYLQRRKKKEANPVNEPTAKILMEDMQETDEAQGELDVMPEYEEASPVYEEDLLEEAQSWESENMEPVIDINPYTGREYESNSVRMHPKRIGYVQVYDRSDHQWADMTEWAFLGYQERKKALLGKDYDPPIYLD